MAVPRLTDMPFALILALAASLGIHAAALFGPDIDLVLNAEPPPLIAELRPLPKALATSSRDEPKAIVKQPPRKKASPAVPVAQPVTAREEPAPMAEVPGNAPEVFEESTGEEAPPSGHAQPVPVAPRLPARGQIRYRVDRGDTQFEIGRAESDWEISEGQYTLRLRTETTGLVWLFKPYLIEMESRGHLTAEGLQPTTFRITRNGVAGRETAEFDWDHKQVRVAGGASQPLAEGAQDLLSFNFHLGFMPESRVARWLPIATGKKYGLYRLDVVGDEVISVPAGEMRTLHLRAPGVNTTELWLAYDYLLLPVKIRHEDGKGNSLVQVATGIRLGAESED